MKSHTNVLLPLLGIHILCVCAMSAQEENSPRNSLQEGKWALQFSINSNFTLSSFEGATLSAQYQTSDLSAWRAGVTMSGISQKTTSQQTLYYAFPPSETNSSSNTIDQFSIDFALHRIWYLNTGDPVHLYLGAGPQVSYSHSKSDQQSNNNDLGGVPGSSESVGRTTGWEAGASGLLGVECFVTRSISLHAEYGLTILYAHSSSTEYSTGTSAPQEWVTSQYETKNNGWSLDPRSVLFGISIFF